MSGDVRALSSLEARALLSLLRGGWTAPLVRRQLRYGWGLCWRHFWWYAAADCELYGRPFKTALLCQELIERGAAQLRLPLVRPSRRVLGFRPAAPCVTCEAVGPSSGQGSIEAELAGWERRRLATVTALVTTTSLLHASEPEWATRTCPQCVGGDGPPCRAHLVRDRTPRTRSQVAQLASSLDELHVRLYELVRSMSWQGPEASPAARASWVHALGWLAGWPPPWTIAPREDSASETMEVAPWRA